MRARHEVVRHDRENATHRGAPHEAGCEQSAGSAGAERNGQSNGFGKHYDQQEFPGELSVENVADRVVTDSEYPWHEEADDAEAESANGGPPHFIEREFLELIFHPIEELAEANRGDAADQS